MDLTPDNLAALTTGYRANFQQGLSSLGESANLYAQIATDVPSTTRAEAYPWLKTLPKMREWLGDRVIHALGSSQFAIVNRKFEHTEGVLREAIEDDTFGLYAPLMTELGRLAGEHPNELVVEVLESNPRCYDGQNLFDTDHPVLDSTGHAQSVANVIAGAGSAWYVFDLSRAVRPLIFQRRRNYDFRTINRRDDSQVFLSDQYLYGVDARVAAGPALWQLAVKSTAAFTAANYEAARNLLHAITGDHARKLGLKHTHTMVPQNLEGPARKVIVSSSTSGGETNEWQGSSILIVNPWLAQS